MEHATTSFQDGNAKAKKLFVSLKSLNKVCFDPLPFQSWLARHI